MLTLLPTETIIIRTGDPSVMLTSHRILYQFSDLERSHNQNIKLEHIISSERRKEQSLFKLGLSIFFLLLTSVSLVNLSYGYMMVFGLPGLFCLRLYFASLSDHIIISSPQTRILINARKMKKGASLDFMKKVEFARKDRIANLEKRRMYCLENEILH